MLLRKFVALAAIGTNGIYIVNAATNRNEFTTSTQDFERHLASKAHEIFSRLTPEEIASAVPLELTIDGPKASIDTSHAQSETADHLRGRKNHKTAKKHKKGMKNKTRSDSETPTRGLKEKDDNDKLNEVVDDSDWPYKGPIQSATGRILFKFSSNQIYKCSGTVVQDDTTGRSIVLTAAHCAYNDLSKEFASMAIFIPDQDETRGSKSDFNCHNDLYGCWVLSFAVVERGWTEKSFPYNVGFDYAYYVVHDRSSTHQGGYGENVTGKGI